MRSDDAIRGDPEHVRHAFAELNAPTAVGVDVTPGIIESGDAEACQVASQELEHVEPPVTSRKVFP